MLMTMSQQSDSNDLEHVFTTSIMRELGRMSQTNSFYDVAQFLNSDIDPYGVIRAGMMGLDAHYTQGSGMWIFEWCRMVVSLPGVPPLLHRHYIRLFIQYMILPRFVTRLALDALAPVIFVCFIVGGSCNILSIDAVHAKIATIRNPETFMFLNNYIVSNGNARSISVYISYVIRGYAHTACTDIMMQNGMADAIDSGVILIRLIDAWLSTERNGVFRIIRHVIGQSVYLAVIAHDYLTNTPPPSSSCAMGQLVDVIATALPYMTFDFTKMDTSDPSWVRIIERTQKTTMVPHLPWPVPTALYGTGKLL